MRHLVLEGSPRERGRRQGKTWTKEIHALATLRKGLLKAVLKDWSERKIAQLVDAHLEVLQKDSELWEEFRGICESAQISEHDLLILNNHTDLRDFAAGDFDTTLFESLNECSCFAVRTEKGVVAGQTWDMHGSATPFVAHLTLKKDGRTQELFTLTGCFGLTGINSSGLGVYINNLRSRELSCGLAWPALIRKILDCSTIADAQKSIQKNMPSGGRNFLLVDKANAVCVEVTGKRVADFGSFTQPQKNFLVHTNHYLSPLQNSEELDTRSKTTFLRYEYLSHELQRLNLKNPSPEKLADELFLGPQSATISIPLSQDSPHASATCGGLLYDHTHAQGFSFAGVYAQKDVLKF